MSGATIYYHPDGYDTSGKRLLGRHSAGEGFLRGYLQHADVDVFHLWNVLGLEREALDKFLHQLHPPDKPVVWIPRPNRNLLRDPGVLNIPGPDVANEAWSRQLFGPAAYSICGVTHTTATDGVMRLLGDLITGPVFDYDALICTSSAVRASVEVQLDGVREYLSREFGPRRLPEPMRATIPLGVNVGDFQTTPAMRKQWRDTLDIPENAAVALFVGRFNTREKMNPALMALALERAAQSTGREIYWVNSGWAESDEAAEAQHRDTRALCPSIHYRVVDGRPASVRRSIWSVADFFISFSDNIQETFGLTPIEAMAAGLPSVVTDWNGYKDTVRHGVDGFRIPTYTPSAGEGVDLAYAFATKHIGYSSYVSATAQYTAIDLAEAAAAISILVTSSDRRRQLGDEAKRRALEVFDWRSVIPQYQALWAEQNARRLRSAETAPVLNNPFRPDPFKLFASYPSAQVTNDWHVRLPAGMSWELARGLLESPLAIMDGYNRPSLAEVEVVMNRLQSTPEQSVRELLAHFVVGRRPPIGRGLLWLARFGVVVLSRD